MGSIAATNGNYSPISLVPPHNLDGLGGPKKHAGDGRLLLILDTRALDRECLAQSMKARETEMEILALGSIEDWRKKQAQYAPLSAILLNVGGKAIADTAVAESIRQLSAEFAVPLIVLADTDDLNEIMIALECGAKGYIPSSVGIEVCIEAIGLALAGGIFVPASSVIAMRQMLESGAAATRPMDGMFTVRQTEVVEALRRGKANKIIAHELHLRESTVKVHIRNIMKTLKATNRTEVAFKINNLFPAGRGKSEYGTGASR